MECTWDAALLKCGEQIPSEILQVIQQHGSTDQYLESITRASLDARYTYILFAHCENIFAHICATLRTHGSQAAAVATLGRLVPIAPYLTPYATQLLANESRNFRSSQSEEEDLVYLLGLFRLLRSDHSTFTQHVDFDQIRSLLTCSHRPTVYLAIRILQICLSAADHWFEEMLRLHLGEDTPVNNMNGQWDDRIIDYRFLTLWEDEQCERVRNLIEGAKFHEVSRPDPEVSKRVIPSDSFHPSTALVGKLLIPRVAPMDSVLTRSDELVSTASILHNLQSISAALKSPQPLLLHGLAGSGKTLLIRHVAQQLGKLDKMVTLHLNEQSDAKLLIGVYTTGDTPGTFEWRPGVLTTAVQEGRWVLIEDLDRAPNEIIGTLLPLIEQRELLIASRRQTIAAAQGFRIVATVRSSINHRGEETQPLAHMLGARHWQHVPIVMPTLDEQQQIAQQLYPSLGQLLPQFMNTYERLQALRRRAVLIGQSKTGILRAINPRDLLKWCSRATKLLEERDSFTSADMDHIFMEAVDCFVGALPDGEARNGMAAVIAEQLRIDPQRRDYLLGEREVRYDVNKSRITIGHYSLPCAPRQGTKTLISGSFSTNPHTSRMLERVAAAVMNREPLLLVGETGVGKTTAVQHLASHLGKKLEPFNLSQQSEAGDLLGGFKPVTARSLIVPMKDEFDELFQASFSRSKNQQFLELLGKQFARSNWKAVCKLWQQALRMVDQQRQASPARQGEAPSKKRKVESKKTLDFAHWDAFAARVVDLERRLTAGSEAFVFSFVEGNIVKAVRNGDWVLLDEINLASPDTLEAIVDLLDSSTPSLLLTEAGNVERIDAHPDFRVFAAMNPATDVGKKDLPSGIRSRFTELYVEGPDRDIKSLQSIVRSYLPTESTADPAIALDISTLYQKIQSLAEQNKLVDGAGQKPHFSLRTLTRTLTFAKHVAQQCILRRALYEGFQMSFLTFLDAESARSVQPLLEQHLLGKRMNVRSELQRALRKPDDGHRWVQGYPGSKHWVRQGKLEPQEQPHYIITPFIQSNLENLVRASSTRQFPVLIQGPTSSGKTSMIEYLAKRTGHKFVRINNHEHTDLQEYLGTYVSGADGRLSFQEGLLVRALRDGHWIVLDELNLAPTDVLEALNRLLDDNRELLIPETQETVRPHADFMLFATQNPAGLYGGRKTLSRAFRNRFLELHFDDIPVDELQEILHRRTQLPESRCRRIVTVYKELSLLRQENRLFEQKSFATLRDLFRWALRPNDTIEQLAANGFMLLAERVRKPEEQQALKGIIERVMSAKGPRVTIDEGALYAAESSEIRAYERLAASQDVVWTKAMRRLYVLVSRAIQNDEPVLLVGETGCGKTTVCQMLADALKKSLHTVNAHQNTETGDLIGSQRPVRNRAAIESSLREQLVASPLLRSLETAAAHPTDALLEAYDRAIASLDSSSKQMFYESAAHAEIQRDRTRFKALFEWVDGSLVQAMRDGAFFLLDEISLADDSVLERINSVLEPQRSILLAEKGSLDSFVTAATGFQMFATMNPGGDYGKRELSPALRNRFTEIWVPALSDSEDIVLILSAKLVEPARPYAHAMVAFAQWFRNRYNTSASSSISVRDALAWVEFVSAFADADTVAAVVHGAAMVYIDTLGANPAGLMTLTGRDLADERSSCLVELSQRLNADAAMTYNAPADVVKSDEAVHFGPFRLRSLTPTTSWPQTFTFDPPTTRRNAMRVVRAMQLSKPVMLEGSPGVGKTALVTAIATAAGVPLTRINLSEQTDLLDLFGSDAPVEGAATGTFSWRDAPFLRAMKNGEWVLLDEMNLAAQSVLEGLNACLDHRGEVYVPELGQTFSRHPHFRLFAAQNPHHQGGGRKGLPASFVNRFTVVYADAFQTADLTLICRRSFPHVDVDVMERAVSFIEKIDLEVVHRRRFGANGGPWEFNLRDVSRWLALLSSDAGLLKSGNARDSGNFLFAQRFRSASDRGFATELFTTVFPDTPFASDLFTSISSSTLQLGVAILPRDPLRMEHPHGSIFTARTHEHLRVLESVMLCVQQRWPVVLTGPSGAGKTSLLKRLAANVGASLVTISMNAETDAMDLIGGYEQSDPLRQGLHALDQLQSHLLHMVRTNLLDNASLEALDLLMALRHRPNEVLSDPELLPKLHAMLGGFQPPEVQALLDLIQRKSAFIDKARFEWMDGLLINALQQGEWLVLDNANLCSSSVLDRLNSLLEPNGTLIINEHTEQDGAPRIIKPHDNFRIFLVVDPRYGELSRAMRNRAVELWLPSGEDSPLNLQPLWTESAMARFNQMRSLHVLNDVENFAEQYQLVTLDHIGLRDQSLLPRLREQLDAGLGKDTLARYRSPVGRLEEQHHAVAGLYENAASRAQASADFARVQTVHPLNNQPLVQQNQQMLHRALTLGFLHDITEKLAPLQERFSVLNSTQSVVRRLGRMQRVGKGDQKPSERSSILLQVLNMLRFTLQWTKQSGGNPVLELSKVKPILYRLHAFWAYLERIVDNATFDQASLTAWISAVRAVTKGCSDNTTQALGSLITFIQQALAAFDGQNKSLTGQACAPLWRQFRPVTPRNMAQLNAIQTLEELVVRFDRLCSRFEQPLATLASLRLSLCRSLNIITATASEVDSLAQKLEVVFQEGEREFPEEVAPKPPHFAVLFESICRQIAVLNLDSRSVAPELITSLELLAARSTKGSIIAVGGAISVQNDFQLISCALQQPNRSEQKSQADNLAQLLFGKLASVGEVSLANMNLLQAESKTIGQILAGGAHSITKDKLLPLDACLSRLVTGVLHALKLGSDDQLLQEMGASLMAELHDVPRPVRAGTSGVTTYGPENAVLACSRTHLHAVVQYLQGFPTDTSTRMQQAADAWASFALVCLTLYVPDRPFDPAMMPRLSRDVHRQTVDDLTKQLLALRALRQAYTGDDASLRARTLQEDINDLGPEPDAEEVCRPELSEITQVQSELDILMRAVQPLHQSFTSRKSVLSDDDLLWTNLDRIRGRLHSQFRAYADITTPIVGFLDCLRMSRVLSVQARSVSPTTSSVDALEAVSPYVKATSDTWLSDEKYCAAMSAGLGQKETLYLLSVLAARCCIRPLGQASLELRQVIDEQFSRFYQLWKARLSEDQRRDAAKSSLYRYKGDQDLEDEDSPEQLEELFPTNEQDEPNTGVVALQEPNVALAQEVAQLHHALFVGDHARGLSMWDMLQRYADVAGSVESSDEAASHLPAMIRALHELDSTLSPNIVSNRPYNIYTHANIEQVSRLLVLITKTKRRFRELHSAWPEHATPVDVLRLCVQIASIGHAEPLTGFVPLLEKLHGTVNEWQQIASREYSVNEVLEDLTSLIISWRQLELSSWAGLLDRETVSCETDASSWWYIAYENIIGASQSLQHSPLLRDHAKDLLKTLEGFLTSCGLGEFVPRLNMLRDFEAHLAAYNNQESPLEVVRQALANFVVYHKHFELTVMERLAKGRAELEKSIKNVIQVASWKDRNIETLRQSAKSSHKKLLRLVRKYRSLLAQPVASMLQSGVPQKQAGEEAGPVPRNLLDTVDPQSLQSDLLQVASWSSRPVRFRNVAATVALMEAKASDAISMIDVQIKLPAFASELTTAIVELQKATLSRLTEKNKTQVQHLKTRKRRLLADVLKDVRTMGFQTSLSESVLAQQAATHLVLATSPAPVGGFNLPGFETTEYNFHRLLAIMPSIREGARKHSDDLTPAEAARCLSLLESMLQMSSARRSITCTSLRDGARLQTALGQLDAFAKCTEPTASPAGHDTVVSEANVKCLAAAMATCVQLVQSQSDLSGCNYSNVVERLQQVSVEIQDVEQDYQSLKPLPIGINSSTTDALQARFEQLTPKLQTIIEDATAQHPELGPTLSQLVHWTHHKRREVGNELANGHIAVEAEAWTQSLLQALDQTLGSLQDLEQKPAANPAIQDGKAWLVEQLRKLDVQMDSLHLRDLLEKVESLLRTLPHVVSAPGMPLAHFGLACRAVQPVFNSFYSTYQGLLSTSLASQKELNKLAFQLATSFLQLTQQGFCSPSDKAANESQKPGEVESGTGLGEGEGGEDISKEVGDEEDLSELAQEANSGRQDEEIEDEKDAVDMADQEMEGELGDDPGPPEDEEAGDTDADDAGVEEEAGNVDDLGATTVDEKMWDEGKNEDQSEKQAENAKGSDENQDLAAGEQNRGGEEDAEHGSQADGVEEDTADDAEVGEDETEEVKQQGTEMMDAHVDDQEKLDLPDDVAMDGQDAKMDGSDVEDLPDIEEAEQQSLPENLPEENPDNDAEGPQEDDATDPMDGELSPEHAADEEQENEDGTTASDILMRDEDDAKDEERPDDMMFGETGDGADENETTVQQSTSASAAAAQQDDTTEAAAEQEQQPDAGASGQTQGTKVEDAKAGAEDGADEQSRLPYKQLGDVLDEWYKQHRQIESARKPEEPTADRAENVDMAEASFEHLPDDQAEADTQALGAASAEQSTALDEDGGLPVNDELDPKTAPINEHLDEAHPDDDEQINDSELMQPSDVLRQDDRPNAFVGEPINTDVDAEMDDDFVAPDEDHLDKVDRQLSNTHIDQPNEIEVVTIEEARRMWSDHEASTRNLALVLTEHLRLILQPTLATKMRGDFRTGKRLNIKRIIPYIASSYKRDKIWMRRSVPSKRSYQIMLAIDDSNSMAESGSRDLAFETLALVAKSMALLEVGELSVVGFGESVRIAHDFNTPFTSETGAEVFRQFNFAQTKTNVRQLLSDSIELFRSARLKAAGSASELWQLQLIISDGVCEDHPSIRQLVRQAHEERIMLVFIVVDAAAQTSEAAGGPKQSILDLQTAEFVKDHSGEMQLRMLKYLDTFPFKYYLIVRDVRELPGVLAGALRQWFAEVAETGG